MTSVRASFKIAIATATCLLLAGEALAQAIDIPMIVTGSHDKNTWATADYSHQFNTDVKNSPAEFSRNNVSVVAGHRITLSDDVFLVGNAVYNGSYYDFSQGTTSGLRWNDIHRLTLMAGLGWKASDNWNLVFLALGRSDGEGGASFSDTLTGGAAFIADYKWSDTLTTGLIIGALSELEDNVALIPVPTVDWRFADDWLLHFGIVSAAAFPGVGPEVSYRADKWSFAFGGSYQVRRFRLDSDSPSVPPFLSANKGIGQETSFPVFARVGFQATDSLRLEGTAGIALGGEIRSGRQGGGKILKEDYKAAPILGMNVKYFF